MATFNSNVIAAGDAAVLGMYPREVFGTITVPANTTLTAADILPICKIPANARISSVVIDLPDLDTGTPALTLSLVDTLTSPNTYVASSTKGQAPGFITTSDFVHGLLGTAYTSESQLRLVVGVTAGGTVGASAVVIYFRVAFAAV